MTTYAWGTNSTRGRLGTGDTANHFTPTALAGGVEFVELAGTAFGGFGRTEGGLVYAWGQNDNGELGLGSSDTSEHSTPTQITTLSDIVQIAASAVAAFALTAAGVLYGWGANSSTWGMGGDMLGLGDGLPRSSPTLLLSGVAQIACGEGHAVALMADGSLRSTGRNTTGQLGIGSTTNQSTWQTPSISGTVSRLSCGGAHTLALMSDGTVKGCGNGSFGELASAGSGNVTTFTDLGVSGITDVEAAHFSTYFRSAAFAGRSCGFNSVTTTIDPRGCLGIGANSPLSSSTLLNMVTPADVTFVKHSTHGDPAGILGAPTATCRGALGSDGKLYIFGATGAGQLGDGTSPAVTSTPTSSNGLVNVTAFSACGLAVFATSQQSVVQECPLPENPSVTTTSVTVGNEPFAAGWWIKRADSRDVSIRAIGYYRPGADGARTIYVWRFPSGTRVLSRELPAVGAAGLQWVLLEPPLVLPDDTDGSDIAIGLHFPTAGESYSEWSTPQPAFGARYDHVTFERGLIGIGTAEPGMPGAVAGGAAVAIDSCAPVVVVGARHFATILG